MEPEHKPTYGFMQYPQLGFFFCDHPNMDIREIIAHNLKAWMAEKPSLDTIKKLSIKSEVGFGTIQRALNCEGNLTVKNLELIAAAFRRTATELITDTDADGRRPCLTAGENVVQYPAQPPLNESLRALIEQADNLSDEGRWQLVGQAKLMANSYPAAKANHSS